MEKQLTEVITFLETRSTNLRESFNSHQTLDGLDEKQSNAIKMKQIGEAQGIDLSILAIKQFVLKH